MLRRRRLAWLLMFFLACTVASGADWPMYRYDIARSGNSPQELSGELHLRWARMLPPVRSAWPYQARLLFDGAYQPIVTGRLLYIASPNTDSVTAYDTETGRTRWTFYATGPVRLAPTAWQGKLYFVSDDGFLYCVQALTGKLIWKYRGGPPQRRHLGNGRLVSFWAARGGPVIADKVVYFAEGFWPNMGRRPGSTLEGRFCWWL